MIEIPVYSLDGQQADTLSVDEQWLGGEVRPALLKQAYVMYHANQRQGSVQTRNRELVVGSGRKLYRQKGTGRARRGAIRTNIQRGGGVAFGKRPKSWRQSMPVKMRRLAARNAVLAKAVDDEIKIIDDLTFEEPKTRRFADLLKAVGVNRTCLLALDPENRNAALSARNIEDVQTIRIDQLNAYDLLSRRFLVVGRKSFESWLEANKPGASRVEEAA